MIFIWYSLFFQCSFIVTNNNKQTVEITKLSRTNKSDENDVCYKDD